MEARRAPVFSASSRRDNLQTTKAAVLYSLILWLSGYFAVRLRAGKLKVFTKSHIIVAAGAGFVVTILFLATSLARLASTDASLLNIVIVKIFTSAFGHMSVFSQWLDEYWSAPFGPSYGTVTFAGPLELLGYSRRIPGLFEQIIELVRRREKQHLHRLPAAHSGLHNPWRTRNSRGPRLCRRLWIPTVARGQWSGLPLLLIAYITTMWTPNHVDLDLQQSHRERRGDNGYALFIRMWRGSLNNRTVSFERQTS
jgi:hypothetical protein